MSILVHIEEQRKGGECMFSAILNWFKPQGMDAQPDLKSSGQIVMALCVDDTGHHYVEVFPAYVYQRGDKKLLTDKVDEAMEKKKRLAMPNGLNMAENQEG